MNSEIGIPNARFRLQLLVVRVGMVAALTFAAELGMGIDVIGVRGSGATPARVNLMRRAKATPGYLAGKKIVIWCFTQREFSESPGWSMVKR